MNLLEMQEKIRKYSLGRNLNNDVSVRVIDLASEVGELSKEVLKGSDYGNRDFEVTENWCSEIGDVFFALLCIANVTEADLEKCLQIAIDKYDKRYEESNSLGSRIDN